MTGPNKNPFNVMILAAGLGQRMRPLTDEIPKPMVKVSGKPLIGHTLDFLAALNPEKIVVNLHYKPGPLKDYLFRHPLADRIIFSDETKTLLDTGGGVKKALKHFEDRPFIVTNSDAFFEPSSPNPYVALTKTYQGEGALLLVEETQRANGFEGPGDFFMSPDGLLSRRGERPEAPYVFTGLQILDPILFEGVDDQVFSLNTIYDKALQRGDLKGQISSCPWFHIGTPGAIGEAGKGSL
ncbi:MAG: nucleotidyltransferase family protein [Sphingomonadales bacterium]